MKLDTKIKPTLVHAETRGGLRVIRLSDPERRNALSAEMRAAIEAALAAANADPAIAGIVLAAEGRAFCAGGDLGTMEGMTAAEAEARIRDAHRLPRAIHASPKPVVAAVEGICAGAGLALASICDLMVIGAGARFVTAFEKVGLMPDLGACWSVAQRIGPQAARRLFLLGGDLDAHDAAALGLCDLLVAEGAAETEAEALALRLARSAPGTRSAVRALFAALPARLDDVLAAEAATQPRLYLSEDLREGIAAFRARRDPVWTGR
ncbi:enoyl-CoA hydratase/isomerase family protein [Frigidibacter sp. MR17.24]|uniref:enoyl-CoA hydratase/isomerase family protein n=1 Tax=Frigidibacter sp. MR17.24 TaxID=3127345 RepID=UPI003012E2F2